MKIDLELLQKIVAADGSGEAVLAAIRHMVDQHEAKRAKRRPVERNSKRRKRGGPKVDRGGHEVERDASTLSDTPRARLFREGKAILACLSVSESRAGGLLAQWLKLTNDDDQLVMAAIVSAQNKVVPDAPGYILATIRGKLNERSGTVRTNSGAPPSGSTAVLAGVAAAAERRARQRDPTGRDRQAPPDDDAAQRPDPELFGAG